MSKVTAQKLVFVAVVVLHLLLDGRGPCLVQGVELKKHDARSLEPGTRTNSDTAAKGKREMPANLAHTMPVHPPSSSTVAQRIQQAMERALRKEAQKAMGTKISAAKPKVDHVDPEVEKALHDSDILAKETMDKLREKAKIAKHAAEALKDRIFKNATMEHDPYAGVRFAEARGQAKAKGKYPNLHPFEHHKAFPFGGQGYKYAPSQYKHPTPPPTPPPPTTAPKTTANPLNKPT
jgi:hypothetical protein